MTVRILLCILGVVAVSLGNSEKNSHSTQLSFTSHNTTCSSSKFLINLKFNGSFRGITYAKGYPYTRHQKQEKGCYAYGTGDDSLELSLKTNGCGVRLIHKNGEKLSYVVTIIVQSDKFLQQVTNFEVTAQCYLSASKTLSENELRSHRAGKGLKIEDATSKMKAWMEMKTFSGDNRIAVGDQLTVLVMTYLPERIAACVSNCVAHDGLRERMENLTDSRGCTFDSSLVPSMVESDEIRNLQKGNFRHRLHKSETQFAAFKFADAPSLHIKCTLDFYRDSCPTRHCDGNFTPERTRRTPKESKLLETVDVFNSIEVSAPGIDNEVLQTKKGPSIEGREICLTITDITVHLILLVLIIIFMSLCIFCVYWRTASKKRQLYSSTHLITREQFLRGHVNRSFEA